jgi:hypothetical protein
VATNRGGRRKKRAEGAAFRLDVSGQGSGLGYLIEARDGVSLGTFLALDDIKLDVVAFFEAFVSVELDCGVVDEDIGAVFAPDEPVAFCVVKPLDLAFVSSHLPYPFFQMAAGSLESTFKRETQVGAKWFARSCNEFILSLRDGEDSTNSGLFALEGAGVELDADEGLAVENGSVVDEPQDFGERDEVEVDAFVVFGLGVAEGEAFGEEDLHPLAEEAGAGEIADERGPLFGAVAGFFDELAFGGGETAFVAVDLAGGELPHILPGGVAILALHDDERVALAPGIIDGEDDDRAIVSNDIAGGFDSVGLNDVVAEDFEERPLVLQNRGEDFGGFGWRGFFARLGLFGGSGFLAGTLFRHVADGSWRSLLTVPSDIAGRAGGDGAES